MNDFERRVVDEAGAQNLRAEELSSLVVSVTLKCNQACAHCQVSSAPERREEMDERVMARVVEIASRIRPGVIDLTGGAPELNPRLRDFIGALKADGQRVQVRTNLTVLEDDEHAGTAGFYAETGVELLASLPCYTERNVQAIRGAGVLDRSVRALLRLNALGYGVDGGPRLDLVYNPVGTTLPEDQAALDALFREQLLERFGISFTRLLTMTNMPVGRLRRRLVAQGAYERYLRALRAAFNPDVVALVQCRHQVEIAWDGRLYDCDFNFGEGIALDPAAPRTVWDFDPGALATRRIVHGRHCFGCTAGAGSS